MSKQDVDPQVFAALCIAPPLAYAHAQLEALSQVQGALEQGVEVGRRLLAPNTAVVFAERDVERPMELIPHGAMRTHDVGQPLSL